MTSKNLPDNKLQLILLGALLSFVLWTIQGWVSYGLSNSKASEVDFRNLDQRMMKLETLMPEIKRSLEDIETEIKTITRCK